VSLVEALRGVIQRLDVELLFGPAWEGNPSYYGEMASRASERALSLFLWNFSMRINQLHLQVTDRMITAMMTSPMMMATMTMTTTMTVKILTAKILTAKYDTMHVIL